MEINGYPSKAAALRAVNETLETLGFGRVAGLLASPESNPKVAKNGKLGVLTAPLHLAPFNLSGFQVCPQASKGCAAACLHTAGNPAYMEGKHKSRIAKTQAYFRNRDAFMALLAFEIAALVRKAERLGMTPGIRLNATSDLPWERRTINVDGQDILLMDAFRKVEFYDYTKITKRALAAAHGEHANGNPWPSNYQLTFSRTEDNDADVAKVLEAGGNVSAVFSLEVYKRVTSQGVFRTWDVIDGDEHDFRPADPRNVIVALKAKGDAKKDTSGFTIR
jgi:hypothetical protein